MLGETLTVNREQAIDHLRESRLAAHFGVLVESLRPSVRLHRRPVSIEDAPIGASRFGGPPDLPPGFVWPIWNVTRRGGFLWRKRIKKLVPLDFLAQIDLTELSRLAPEAIPIECPKDGMLYFFYDIDEQPRGSRPEHALGFRVAYATGFPRLERQSGPPASKSGVPPPSLISVETEWILPAVPACLDGDGALGAIYREEVAPALVGADEAGGLIHRMFGYPQCMQDQDDLLEGDPSRLLLMQIDTDRGRAGAPGWMWGDAGRLYFTIPPADLAKPDLTPIRMRLRCG